MVALAALLKPSWRSDFRNERLLVIRSVLLFILSKSHRTFGVTGRFYLERVRHGAPRILCLLIKFPQLVEEIQLPLGAWSVNWELLLKEHLQS